MSFSLAHTIAAVSVAAAALFFFQHARSAADNARLRRQLEETQAQTRQCEAANQDMRHSIAVLRDLSTVPLKAGDEKTHSLVFVNAFRCEVLLDIGGLPAPEPGRHLQMWAVVEGQYRSMGMVQMQAVAGLQRFPCVPGATGYLLSSETQAEGNSFPSMVLLNTH
ncbi:MAG TPA: anti-sigma factor [Saprospiraceae bacterium]|nr:anti-sigma factor [Saprospiraceae bacterium]HND88268.1 anti-sigma factor [Saprospiraceae bacterium]